MLAIPDVLPLSTMLAEEHTETVPTKRSSTLSPDKDFAVRAAAAKGLGDWHGQRHGKRSFGRCSTTTELAVRLTAAAA